VALKDESDTGAPIAAIERSDDLRARLPGQSDS
jgi:hypothetical protein